MIFTERTITVVNDSATINKPLILYRGDKNVELKITIAESQFKFRNTDASNVIETTDASYAQLVINTPYNSPIFSDVAATKNGAVIFVITEAMVDEIREVGAYEIQIRLLDDNKQSRASIPPVSNAIEIREPIAIEDGSAVDSNAVNVAKVNRALTTTSAPLEAFDSQGNYIKKTWGDGDPITDAALNKMEAGIDGVNKKIANVNNINDTTASATTTYSSNKIETIKRNISSQIKDIENHGVTTATVEAKVQSVIDEKIADGTMGNLTIADGSITENKLDLNLRNKFNDANLSAKFPDVLNLELNEKNYFSDITWYKLRNTPSISEPPKFNVADDDFTEVNDLILCSANSYSQCKDIFKGQTITINVNEGYSVNLYVFDKDSGIVEFTDIIINNNNKTITYTAEKNNLKFFALLYRTDSQPINVQESSNITCYFINDVKRIKEYVNNQINVAETNISNNVMAKANTAINESVNIKSFFKNWDNTRLYVQNVGDAVPSVRQGDSTTFISSATCSEDADYFPRGTVLNLSILSGYKYFIYIFDATTRIVKTLYTERTYNLETIESTEDNLKIYILLYKNDSQAISIEESSNVLAFVYDNDLKKRTVSLEKRMRVIEESQTETSSIFNGKTMVVLGDSLTEVNQHYTKGYYTWIKEILGLSNVTNYGISGSSITTKSKPMCERYANMVNADIVLVMGGTNDCTWNAELGTKDSVDNSTVYGAMKTLCAGLKQKYPTSLVIFITPHYQEKYPHEKGYTAMDISKIIKDVCYDYAIPVYDNNQLSGIYSTNLNYYTVDNCHWNDTAHEMVGKNVAKWILDTFRFIYGN